jgi:hypothetical protein
VQALGVDPGQFLHPPNHRIGQPQFCPGKSGDSVEVNFPKQRLHLEILLMGECTDPTGQ